MRKTICSVLNMNYKKQTYFGRFGKLPLNYGCSDQYVIGVIKTTFIANVMHKQPHPNKFHPTLSQPTIKHPTILLSPLGPLLLPAAPLLAQIIKKYKTKNIKQKIIFRTTPSLPVIDSHMYQQIGLRAQNKLIQEQDQHIEQITEIAQYIKQNARTMNEELEKQHHYAQELNVELDVTRGRLNSVQGKLGDLLETQDAGQICTCAMMACLTVVFSIFLIVF